MQKLKILCVLICLLSSVGFTSCEKKIIVAPIARMPLQVPELNPLSLQETQWVILNQNNAQAVLQKIQDSGRKPVVFALTDEGFANLSVNLSKLQGYISQQNAIILAYKNYYESPDSTVKADSAKTIAETKKSNPNKYNLFAKLFKKAKTVK